MEGSGDTNVKLTLIEKLHCVLNQDSWYKPIFDKLESISNVKREYIAVGMGLAFVVNLILGYGGQLICYAVGFTFPMLKTIEAIESGDNAESIDWLRYWIVFSTLNFVEFFAHFILNIVPLYWLMKCIFLIWCFAPIQNNGSQIMYHRAVYPLVMALRQQAVANLDPSIINLLDGDLSDSNPADEDAYPNLRSRHKVKPSE